MKVVMIGTGYVGTVAGVCLAECGNEVVCVEKDARKVEALSSGNPVIHEPGLEDLLRRNLRRSRLRFTGSVREAVVDSEVIFLTVGTPSSPDGSADLSFLEEAAREVGRNLRKYCVIVNKSTVPVGSQRRVEEWVREETSLPFDVVSNPEFLREGSAVRDFLYPERVVIGTGKQQVFTVMKKLYEPFVSDESRVLRMDPTSAELTKYACNAFLATRISFMNELAEMCDRVGGDVECLRSGMALDSRIGPHFLNAGMGYGGSCFPKDIRALISTARECDLDLRIARATEEVNSSQKTVLMRSVRDRFGESLDGRRFAVWGVSFKPNTDDIREAPAIGMIDELTSAGASVIAYDPVVSAGMLKGLVRSERFEFSDHPYDALQDADALLIATEWSEFHDPDFARMRSLMRHPVLFDGRNCISPEVATAAGFHYRGIGRAGVRYQSNLSVLPVSFISGAPALPKRGRATRSVARR